MRDFRPIDDEQSESAARERNRALDLIPAFLFAVHLICGATILASMILAGAFDLAMAAPIGLLVALGLSILLQVRRRPLSSLAPHLAQRAACIYTILAGGLWAA